MRPIARLAVVLEFISLFAVAAHGTTPTIHRLPQAQPGTTYKTRLSIPPGLGYPFRCALSGDALPKGLHFSCENLMLSGQAPPKLDKSYQFDLHLQDDAGNTQDFQLELTVSEKPEVISLTEAPVAPAPDLPAQTAVSHSSPAADSSTDTITANKQPAPSTEADPEAGAARLSTAVARPSQASLKVSRPVHAAVNAEASPDAATPAADAGNPPPKIPSITTKVIAGASEIDGYVPAPPPNGPSTQIYVCYSLEKPADPPTDCATSPAEALGMANPGIAATPQYVNADIAGAFKITLFNPLPESGYIWLEVRAAAGSDVPFGPIEIPPGTAERGLCKNAFNDCDFNYLLLGGIQQSGLSSQSSQTNPFYYFYLRAPFDRSWGSIFLRSRFLGTNSSTDSKNVVAAATDASGTLTTSALPQSINAVDYTVGWEMPYWAKSSKKNGFTLGPVIGAGATTPVGASTVANGFVIPGATTQQCTQLLNRFPSIPRTGTYLDSDKVAQTGCSVEPALGQTSATAANPGTLIQYLAFTNQDRQSFLMKWGAGIRLTNRWQAIDSGVCSNQSGVDAQGRKRGLCSRSIVDITVGQDQAITGGVLRAAVVKADAIVPLVSGIYFFGQSDNRLVHNQNLPTLVLAPQAISVGPSTLTTAVTIPSSNVWVLPYQQQNRDYYSIGVGIDVSKLLVNATKSKAD